MEFGTILILQPALVHLKSCDFGKFVSLAEFALIGTVVG